MAQILSVGRPAGLGKTQRLNRSETQRMAGNLYTGTLELLILRTLQGDPIHGYGIARSIRDRTEGVLDVEQGALYPALHRLNRKGWVRGDWGETETGRRARFYSLTEKGKRALQKETVRWDTHAQAVYAVLNGKG